MKTKLLALAFLALVTGCTSTPQTTDTSTPVPSTDGDQQSEAPVFHHRYPASARRAVLPDQPKWQALYDFVDNLDLTDPRVEMKMHAGEGTSVYGVVSIDGKPYGAIIPENSSASVTGETMGFTLARALGVTEVTQPGVYHFLSGPNLDAFIKIIPTEPLPTNANKEANRVRILKRYKDQPQGMDAVFKKWGDKPKDFDPINGKDRMINTAYVLPGSRSPVASFLKCDGPQPSPNTKVTFAGGTNDELSVAKEISAILVIDALEGQWDRFSGGNLQTMTSSGYAKFVAVDNGGTWGGKWPPGKPTAMTPTDRNLSMVTRFDRNVAAQVLGMDDLIEHGRPYLGLRNEADFVSAFDIAQAPNTFTKFKDNLKATAAWIRQHPNCYF